MKQPELKRDVVPLTPPPAKLLELVRATAEDSANVFFKRHAQDRMEERGITTLDALRVLRSGEVKGDISFGKQAGEWKCKIVKQMKGTREIGVVTIIANARRLYIVTVEWEDL